MILTYFMFGKLHDVFGSICGHSLGTYNNPVSLDVHTAFGSMQRWKNYTIKKKRRKKIRNQICPYLGLLMSECCLYFAVLCSLKMWRYLWIVVFIGTLSSSGWKSDVGSKPGRVLILSSLIGLDLVRLGPVLIGGASYCCQCLFGPKSLNPWRPLLVGSCDCCKRRL